MLKHLLFYLFLTVSTVVNAQHYFFKTFTIEEGLPHSTVWSIAQDKKGYLWIGTEAGIARYDSKSFINYNTSNGLSGNMVRSIFCDSRNFIWIGTDKGITVYAHNTFYQIVKKDGLSGKTVLKFIEDHAHRIWAATSDGGINRIVCLPGMKFKIDLVINNEKGLTTDFIWDMYEDKQHNLWLGLYGALNIVSFKGNNYTIKSSEYDFNIPASLYTPTDDTKGQLLISAIEPDNKGNLFVSTLDKGLFKIDITGKDSGRITLIEPGEAPYHFSKNLNDPTIWCMELDHLNRLWIGTNNGGINRMNQSNMTIFTEKNGLPNNQILSLFRDSENNMWAGSASGLTLFTGERFIFFNKTDGLPDNQVTSIVQDKRNNYWLSTFENGLSRLNFTNGSPVIRNYTIDNGLVSNSVTSLKIDQKGILWIGTQQGISKTSNGQSFTNYTVANNDIKSEEINCLYVDAKNNVWFGSKAGYFQYDGKGFSKVVNVDLGLNNDEIQAITQSNQGNIWFGTLGELHKYTPGKNDAFSYNEVEGLSIKTINCLAADKSGDIWIGTFGGGIFKMDVHSKKKQPIKQIANASVLGTDIIKSMLFVDDYTLLAGTNVGFIKILLNKDYSIRSVKQYHKSDGFMGFETMHNAINRNNDGTVWFGTFKNLTLYNPKEDVLYRQPPYTYIQSIRLTSKEKLQKKWYDSISTETGMPVNLELPYNQNNLVFDYIAIHYKNPSKVFMKYKLEGFDKEWSEQTQDLNTNYTNLEPGHYTFKVLSCNSDGFWTDIPAQFSFVIKKPFWQTWWYYISEISFILLLLFITFHINKSTEKSKLGTILTFISIILIFEFINVSIDPYVDKFSNQIPLYKLILNVILAISLNPLEKVISRLDKYI